MYKSFPSLKSPLALGLCLWYSWPGSSNELFPLTILVHSLFTAQHPLGSGYKRGHGNISSGCFSHLENAGGMDYVWPSLKYEQPVCPTVWPKGCHENSSFSRGLCLLFSTGFGTSHGVCPGQETKQFSPWTPSSAHTSGATHKPPFHNPHSPFLKLACPPALNCHLGIPKEL